MRWQHVWQTLFRRLSGRSGPAPNPKRRRCRPLLEALEDRFVPSSWYVSTLGSDDNAGSQAAPFASIQHAVNVAQSGDYILVAQGTYGYVGADRLGDDARFQSPGNTATISSAFLHVNPAVVLVLDKALQIYGGFDNGFTTWAPSTYRTYIDGGVVNRGVYVLDDGSAAGAAFGAAGLDMEGFTIQDCKATGESGLSGGDSINAYGAGMWINDAARNSAAQGGFLLKNMVFRGNYAGGNNTTSTTPGSAFGAALALRAVGNMTLDSVTFDSNLSQSGTASQGNTSSAPSGSVQGGAVFLDRSTVSGSAITLYNNQATVQGNLNSDGGGMALVNSTASLQNVIALNNSLNLVLHNNISSGHIMWGGAAAYGGAFYAETSTLTLVNADIRGNVSVGGLQVVNMGKVPQFNWGPVVGLALAAVNSSVSFNQVQVINNSALENTAGASIWISRQADSSLLSAQINNTVVTDNNSTGVSGAISFEGVDATISHTTVANNGYFGYDGVSLVSGMNADRSPHAATVTISDSILARSNVPGAGTTPVLTVAGSPNMMAGSPNVVTLNHVLYAGNVTDNAQVNTAGIFNGLDTVVRAASADFTSPGAPNYDYSIQPNSPAVGQGIGGTPADIEGNPFITPDLGAYASPAFPRARSTIALFDPETAIWQIRLSNSGGFFPDGPVFAYGSGGGLSKPVVGDWNGDGQATIGVVEVKAYDFNGKPFLTNAQGTAIPVSVFELKNTDGPGGPDIVVPYGSFSAMPVVGNWDNNPQHIDHIGVVETQNGVDVWKLRNSFTPGVPDITVAYGALGAIPVVGDWNNDSTATMGVAENVGGVLTWKLRNSFTPGAPDVSVFGYGLAYMQPLVGDWNSDGVATVGVYDPRTGLWQLRNENNPGAPDAGKFVFGPAFASGPYAEPLIGLAGDFDGLV